MSERACIGCGEVKTIKAHGLCRGCYIRRWRSDPAVAERHRAQVRAWKAANRDAVLAYNREYETTHKARCTICGGPKNRQRANNEPCRRCIEHRAAARRERIVELWERGLLIREIAAEIGTSTAGAGQDIKRLRTAGLIGRRYKASAA